MISVIMPVYNSEKTLHRSIDSIINQNSEDWELIAIDDGSTDNSYELMKEYAKKDKRIKVYTQKNCGPGMTRNNGINKAQGEYIAFLDSDDTYEYFFLKQAEEIIADSYPNIIFYDCIEEYPSGKSLQCNRVGRFRTKSIKDLVKLQMVGTLPWGMVKIIRRDMIAPGICAFTSNSVGEEAIFSFDILRNSSQVAFMNKPVYHYYQSSTGQHKKGEDDPWKDVVKNMKLHLKEKGLYDQYSLTINTFAYNALLISLYRIAISNTYLRARKLMKAKRKEYNREYNINTIDRLIINSSQKILHPFIEANFLFPVFVASKIREYKNEKI